MRSNWSLGRRMAGSHASWLCWTLGGLSKEQASCLWQVKLCHSASSSCWGCSQVQRAAEWQSWLVYVVLVSLASRTLTCWAFYVEKSKRVHGPAGYPQVLASELNALSGWEHLWIFLPLLIIQDALVLLPWWLRLFTMFSLSQIIILQIPTFLRWEQEGQRGRSVFWGSVGVRSRVCFLGFWFHTFHSGTWCLEDWPSWSKTLNGVSFRDFGGAWKAGG